MPKVKLYMDFTSVTKPLVMEAPHTHHSAGEYIVLATADSNNFYDGFDAETEHTLRADRLRRGGRRRRCLPVQGRRYVRDGSPHRL